MKASLYIARHYIFFGKKTRFVHLLNLVSFLGLLFGTAALIVVLSVFNGLEEVYQTLFSSTDPELRIESKQGKGFLFNDTIKSILDDEKTSFSYSKIIKENILLRNENQQVIAKLIGVDSNFFTINHLDSSIISGRKPRQQKDLAIGASIGSKLGINPEDPFALVEIFVPQQGKIQLSNPEGAFVKSAFNPCGLFSIQPEWNSTVAICRYTDAITVLQRPNWVSSIDIRIDDQTKIDKIKSTLVLKLGKQYSIKTKYEQKASIYAVFNSEKWWSFLILIIITFIASLNLVGSQNMLVLYKHRDIQMFMTMGMEFNNIRQIFFWGGMIIVIGGVVVGLLTGALLCLLQEYLGLIGFNGGEGLMVDDYPVLLNVKDCVFVGASTIVLGALCCFLAISNLRPGAIKKLHS